MYKFLFMFNVVCMHAICEGLLLDLKILQNVVNITYKRHYGHYDPEE